MGARGNVHMCPSLGLEQVQHIQLTAEVQQGIEVMAMPIADLHDLICNRAMDNPFLKIEESEQRAPDERGGASITDAREREAIEEEAWSCGVEAGVWDAAWMGRQPSWRADDTDPDEVIARTADDRVSLEVGIMQQLAMDLRDPLDLRIAEHLLCGLDERGYLRMDTDIVADVLDTDPNRVERVLAKMQTGCTPAGIGSRSLQECLIAQLVAAGEDDAIIRKAIECHLPALAEGRLSHVASALGISSAEVKRAFERIRHLDPHPAAIFERACPPAIPEIEVIKDEGRWAARVRSGMIPRMMLDEEYVALFDGRVLDKSAAARMREMMREAQGLIRAVDMRKAAVISIATAVIDHQQAFFDVGPAGLRSLAMADVAYLTELSESTVSRVANSVTMDTPRGMLSLRYFFHSGVGGSATEEDISSLAVKQAIQELVDAEDKRAPLSDAKLVDLLSERGMSVSRRTVNKYRTALGILSRAKRRTYE